MHDGMCTIITQPKIAINCKNQTVLASLKNHNGTRHVSWNMSTHQEYSIRNVYNSEKVKKIYNIIVYGQNYGTLSYNRNERHDLGETSSLVLTSMLEISPVPKGRERKGVTAISDPGLEQE